MIENDGLKAAFRGFDEGDRQQAVDLVTFRNIADQVLVIIGAVGEFLLESDLTCRNLQACRYSMVSSSPTSKTTSTSVGVGVIVLVGEAVCEGVFDGWVRITSLSLSVGKFTAVGLTAVADGMIGTPALGASPDGVRCGPFRHHQRHCSSRE